MGYGIRKKYDLLKVKLLELGWGSLPIGASEFNCFTAATADNASMAYFTGKHVMDYPSSAACLAAHVAGFATTNDPPLLLSVHKFVQNLGNTDGVSSGGKSRIGKNGKKRKNGT